MPAFINHALCCYAQGKCNCASEQDTPVSNQLKITAPQKCCVEICPVNALTRNGRIIVNVDLCTDCGECVRICCSGAISMSNYRKQKV